VLWNAEKQRIIPEPAYCEADSTVCLDQKPLLLRADVRTARRAGAEAQADLVDDRRLRADWRGWMSVRRSSGGVVGTQYS